MSRTALLLAVLCLAAVTANAQEPGVIGPILDLGAPTIRVALTGDAYLLRTCKLDLPAGKTVVAYPFARFDTPLDAVRIEVLSPAAGVELSGTTLAPDSKDVVRWTLTAREATAAQIRITHALKGVDWRIEYGADLDRAAQKLNLSGQFIVTNKTKLDWRGAQVQLPDGTCVALDLEQGQTAQIPVAVGAGIAYDCTLMYDPSRYGNNVTPVIRALRDGTDAFCGRRLLAGKVRIFAAGTPREYLGDDSLALLPSAEPLEIKLPGVSDVQVARRVAKSTQVEPRTDIRDKVILFTQDDDIEYEIRNLRRAPVTLLVRDKLDGDWGVQKSSLTVTKTDGDTAEWTTSLQPGETQKVTYTIRRLNQQP
jgi:hypothetical protein